MNDIFISYSRKDSNVVSEFVWKFEQEGFKVWIDKEGIYSGDEFAEVLATAIEQSTVVVFFSSVDSNASKWTAGEIGIANMYNKHIIPVRLDHSPYNKKVIIHLVNLDYIDYTHPERHSEMLEKLLIALRELCHHTDDERIFNNNVDLELYVQERDGLMGYTNNSGKTVIPFIYEEAGKFYNGIARVCRDGHWGFINKTGVAVVPLKYNYVELFSEDYSMFVLGGKYGFVDRTGREVIPPIYDNANPFFEGLAVVGKNNLFGYIDKRGDLAIPFQFSAADDFSESFAAVSIRDKWGFIDHSGRIVVPLIYDEVFNVRNGCANVIKDGIWKKIVLGSAND